MRMNTRWSGGWNSHALYDGGSNKARLAENNWRISELGAERNRVVQEKQNEDAFNRLNYDDHQAQLAALSDRVWPMPARGWPA